MSSSRFYYDNALVIGTTERSRGRGRAPQLQQLIGIDVDVDGDVFGEGKFVESFTNEAA